MDDLMIIDEVRSVQKEKKSISLPQKPFSCRLCLNLGHKWRFCPLNLCFYCNKTGHIKKDCFLYILRRILSQTGRKRRQTHLKYHLPYAPPSEMTWMNDAKTRMLDTLIQLGKKEDPIDPIKAIKRKAKITPKPDGTSEKRKPIFKIEKIEKEIFPSKDPSIPIPEPVISYSKVVLEVLEPSKIPHWKSEHLWTALAKFSEQTNNLIEDTLIKEFHPGLSETWDEVLKRYAKHLKEINTQSSSPPRQWHLSLTNKYAKLLYSKIEEKYTELHEYSSFDIEDEFAAFD